MGTSAATAKQRLKINPWRETTALAIVVIEATWIATWYRSLSYTSQDIAPVQVLLFLSVLMWSSYLFIRVLPALGRSHWIRRSIAIAFLALWIWLGTGLLLSLRGASEPGALLNTQLRSFADLTEVLPGEVFAVAIVLFTAWRGQALLQRRLSQESVMVALRTGLIAFALYILFAAFLTATLPDFWLLLVYLGAGLFGIGAGRIAAIGHMRGARKTGFSRQWLGSLAGSVIATVSAAAALVSLMLAQFSAGVAQLSAIVQAIAFAIVFIILSPFLIALQLLLPDAQPIIVSDQEVTATPTVPAFEKIPAAGGESGFLGSILAQDAGLMPEVRTGLYWLGLLVIIAVVVGLMRTRWVQAWIRGEEERESLTGPPDLWRQLRDLLKFRRENGANLGRGMFDQRQRKLAAARIRRIYGELMELATSKGYPRKEAQTPSEFLPDLERAFGKHNGELASITQAYLQVRYGELPETRAEVDDVEQAWSSVRAAAAGSQQ